MQSAVAAVLPATSQVANLKVCVIDLWLTCTSTARPEMVDAIFATPDESDVTAILRKVIKDVHAKLEPLHSSSDRVPEKTWRGA